jgi:glycosyltransferase involved in cell wall biosynthesis
VHVAVVSQNADLAVDIRPRAEAEALANAGYDVTLVGGTRHPDKLRELTHGRVDLSTYRLPKAAASAAGQVRELGHSFALMAVALRRLGKQRPIDVLHTANPPDNVWLLLSLLRHSQGFEPRFVFDQHDVAPVLAAEKFGMAPRMRAAVRLVEAFERASFGRAALTVFANPKYEERATSRRLLVGRHVVVPNGWRLPSASSKRWSDGRPLIAYIGTINEQDCVTHMIEALALVQGIGHARVVIAGDGSDRARAAERAAELGIANSIEWLGWVTDREQLGSLVRAADVCVAPERDSAFNRLASFVKIVEYMSVGAPVVAHRLPQTEEVCGDTIQYAENMRPEGLAQAIGTLLERPVRAQELGRAALERFDAHVWWGNVGAPRLIAAYAAEFGSPNGATRGKRDGS